MSFRNCILIVELFLRKRYDELVRPYAIDSIALGIKRFNFSSHLMIQGCRLMVVDERQRVTTLHLLKRLEYLRMSLWWRNFTQVELLFGHSSGNVIPFQRNGYREDIQEPVKVTERGKSRRIATEKRPEYTLYRFSEEIPNKTSQEAAFDSVEYESSNGT